MDTSKLLSYETLVRAASGAAGGITAMSVCFPLDTVRTRLLVEDNREARNTLSVLQQLIEEEGIESLYRGLQPTLIALFCSNFVYFYAFHGLRTLVMSNSVAYNALRDLTVAGIAGVINVLLTTPLWVASSRLKMQGAKISAEDMKQLGRRPIYNGIIDALIKICKVDGWTALWSSLAPSLMLASNPAIHFTVYETLKLEFAKLTGQKELGALSFFIVGALSKLLSTVLTYPLQVVQTKLRHDSFKLRKMTIFQVFSHIVRTNGVKGLYKGLEAKLCFSVVTAALMFLCYEKIASFVFRIMHITSHAV